jgi:hypothetical protein
MLPRHGQRRDQGARGCRDPDLGQPDRPHPAAWTEKSRFPIPPEAADNTLQIGERHSRLKKFSFFERAR